MKPFVAFNAAGEMIIGIENNGKLDRTQPSLALNDVSQKLMLDVLMARFERKQYAPVANAMIELPWAFRSSKPAPIGTLNKNYATGEWEISDPAGNIILHFRMAYYEVCRAVEAGEA